MIVMLGNDSHPWLHYLSGKHPRRVGWLVGPTTPGCKTKREWLPYALDNGAWGAFLTGEPWAEGPFFLMLDRIRGERFKPLWAAVPDAVGDKGKTLANWKRYAPRCGEYGHPLAFVAQDGMAPRDVPKGADIVFLGGSFSWKWRHAETFCKAFPRVHIGRVNTIGKLRRAEEMGAESVDGTGWVRRGDGINGWKTLDEHFSKPDPQLSFFRDGKFWPHANGTKPSKKKGKVKNEKTD